MIIEVNGLKRDGRKLKDVKIMDTSCGKLCKKCMFSLPRKIGFPCNRLAYRIHKAIEQGVEQEIVDAI